MTPKSKVLMIMLALRGLIFKTPKGPLDVGYNRGINDAIEVIRHYFPDIKTPNKEE